MSNDPAIPGPAADSNKSASNTLTDVVELPGRIFARLIVAALVVLLVYLCVVMVIPNEMIEKNHWQFANLPMVEAIRLACAVVFVLTLALWVFDTVRWLPFAQAWASRAIWGAAIASILTTGVVFFKDGGGLARMPLEGVWRSQTIYPLEEKIGFFGAQNEVVILYDPDTKIYRGQSDCQQAGGPSFKIMELDPKTLQARVRTYPGGSGEIHRDITCKVTVERYGRRLILTGTQDIFAGFPPFAQMDR